MRTDEQKAIMYAAFKVLEAELKKDGELKPGFYADVTNKTITIQFAPNTVISRDVGFKNDGTIEKKATQNLYGYTFFTLMIKNLKKFKQWNKIRTIIIETVNEALKNGKTSRESFTQNDPELEKEIQQIQEEFNIPTRTEQTPRNFKNSKLPPTITIKN